MLLFLRFSVSVFILNISLLEVVNISNISAMDLLPVVSNLESPKPFRQNISFNQTLDKAYKDKLPVIIEFRAKWCAPCVKMEKTTFRNGKVKKYLKRNFYTYGVDVDEYIDLDLLTRFEIESCPTFIFLNYKGQEIRRVHGFMSADELYKQLTSFSKVSKKKKWWEFFF